MPACTNINIRISRRPRKPIRPPYLCRGNGSSFIPLPHGRNRASSASPAPAAPSRRRRWLKSNSVCAWSSPSPYWTQAQVRHRPRPLSPIAAPAALPCWHNLRVCLPSLSASFSLFSFDLKNIRELCGRCYSFSHTTTPLESCPPCLAPSHPRGALQTDRQAPCEETDTRQVMLDVMCSETRPRSLARPYERGAGLAAASGVGRLLFVELRGRRTAPLLFLAGKRYQIPRQRTRRSLGVVDYASSLPPEASQAAEVCPFAPFRRLETNDLAEGMGVSLRATSSVRSAPRPSPLLSLSLALSEKEHAKNPKNRFTLARKRGRANNIFHTLLS